MGQLKLFEDTTHLEPDYFISGNPDKPDELGESIFYTPWQILYPNKRAVVAHQLAEVIDLNRNVIPIKGEDLAA